MPVAEAADARAGARRNANETECRQGVAFGPAGRHLVVWPLAAHHDVVEDTHGAEQPDVLEGAAETLAGAAMGWQPRQVHAIERNGTLGRPRDAVEHVEERRLARAVGTDQRVHG